jgi:hypothetical protein
VAETGSAELFIGAGEIAPHEPAAYRGQPAGDQAQDGSESSRPRRHRNRGRGSGQQLGQDDGESPVPGMGAATVDDEPAIAGGGAADVRRASCTMAQMRRFIKSRPYVPIHELRRRFEIEGCEDDVYPVTTDKGIIYVGLPSEEARFLGDLIKAGEVGCELLLDPCSPAIVGVYAMRPVARS